MTERRLSTPNATCPQGSDPRRRLFWIILVYLVFLVYGSLVPLEFVRMPLGEAVDRLASTAQWRLLFWSRSDCVLNVLLTVPLAFLVMAAACAGRRRWVGLAAAALVVPCCLLLSVGIELAQVFCRHRVGSVGDILAQWLGTLAGVTLWLAWGRRFAAWLGQVRSPREVSGRAAGLISAYLALLVVLQAIPFDLTVSPADMVHKWREGRIHLVPFSAARGDWMEMAGEFVTVAAFLAGLGMVWALAARPARSARGRLLRPLGLGLCVAGLLELIELPVFSRRFDTTDVIAGVAGFVAGWAVGARLGRGAHCQRATHEAVVRHVLLRPGVWGLAVLGWLGVLAMSHWRPFDFCLDGGRAVQRLERVEWLPLADYQGQPASHSMYQLLKKVLLFLPLGLLLTLGVPDAWQRLAGPSVLIGVVAVAVIFEAGQLLLPSHSPTTGDVLIECIGGWLGYVAGRRLRRSEAGEISESGNMGKTGELPMAAGIGAGSVPGQE